MANHVLAQTMTCARLWGHSCQTVRETKMPKKNRSTGRFEIVIRTVPVSKKLYGRSLEEVLAKPVPFPRFKKVSSDKSASEGSGSHCVREPSERRGSAS
jgi:hypothetical protein